MGWRKQEFRIEFCKRSLIPRIWEDSTTIRTIKLYVDTRKIKLIQHNVQLITFLLTA